MKKLIVATKNEGKAKEFKEIFSALGYEVLTLLDLSEEIGEIEETGTTFEENAMIKADTIKELFNIPVLADDSGLEVDALEGRPGIFSARYAGLEKNDQKNVEKLLQKLAGVEEERRAARFVCALAFSQPNVDTVVKRGTCEGRIGTEPIGENGFGYDPVFYPRNKQVTLAQLLPAEKNAISHRRDAIDKMVKWIKLGMETE